MPFQLVYDNLSDRAPEFCFSTEKILVPGSPCFQWYGAGTAHPLIGYSIKGFIFLLVQSFNDTSNSDFYKLFKTNIDFLKAS